MTFCFCWRKTCQESSTLWSQNDIFVSALFESVDTGIKLCFEPKPLLRAVGPFAVRRSTSKAFVQSVCFRISDYLCMLLHSLALGKQIYTKAHQFLTQIPSCCQFWKSNKTKKLFQIQLTRQSRNSEGFTRRLFCFTSVFYSPPCKWK